MRILCALKAHSTNENGSRRAKKPANYTLSRSARWFCRRLKKPLQKDSESKVVDFLILQEAERLGLKQAEEKSVQAQPTQEAA